MEKVKAKAEKETEDWKDKYAKLYQGVGSLMVSFIVLCVALC